MLDVDESARRLATYIAAISDFEMIDHIDGNYRHIGATLADASLQSNMNYERQIRHRIVRIRQIYREYVTLTDLQSLLSKMSPQKFLDWKGTRKPGILLDLISLLSAEGVDTQDDLCCWLLVDGNHAKMKIIPFVGDKTVDYLKILVGLPVAAMDRHLLGFLRYAGLGNLSYSNGQDVVHRAAEIMGINRAHVDHSIWRYMSRSTAPGARLGPVSPPQRTLCQGRI